MRHLDVQSTVSIQTGSSMTDLIRNFVFIVTVVPRFFDGCIASTLSTSPVPTASELDTATIVTAPGLATSYALVTSAIGSGDALDFDDNVEDLFRRLARRNWQSYAYADGSKRTRTRRSCRSWLAGHIEGCLVGYERLLMSTNAYSTEGVSELMVSSAGRSVLRHLCSEYAQTMQCLHERLTKCPPDEVHLYLIAYRLGHVRTSMEQTCIDLNNVVSRSTSANATLLPISSQSATSNLAEEEPPSSLATATSFAPVSTPKLYESTKWRPVTKSPASSISSHTTSAVSSFADVGKADTSPENPNIVEELSLRNMDNEMPPCRLVEDALPSSMETESKLSLLPQLLSPSSSSPIPVAIDKRCRENPSSSLRRTATAAATFRVQYSKVLTTIMCVIVAMAVHLAHGLNVRRIQDFR